MDENPTVTFPDRDTVSVETRPRPDPGAGEVLVETRRTLVSTGTELARLAGEVQGAYGAFPMEPGYSNVGEVVAVGEGVDESWVGRRVASGAGHAAYVTADAEACLRVPEPVADEEAVFFRLGQVAMNGVRRGEVEWGEGVCVYGLGLVGQLATRFCRVAGARRVVGLDVAEERLDYLPDVAGVSGANPRREGYEERVREALGGRAADVVVEATGSADAIPEEFGVLREQGRFVLLSSPRETGEFDYYRHCHRPGYELVGAHLGTHPDVETPANQWTERRNGELFLSLLEEGRLGVGSLVTHRFDAADAVDAYDLLREDRTRAVGVLLDWT